MIAIGECAVIEMWQDFIDECLIHVDESVQVCNSFSLQ